MTRVRLKDSFPIGKLAATSLTRLNAFPEWKMYRVNIGSGNGLVLNRGQPITRNNADPVHRRIYVALGGDYLNQRRPT